MVLSDSFYYQPVQIDTINTRVNADLFAKEGDANGRGMVVQITENGIIKDTTGITLRLQWSHISVGVSGFTDFEIVDATKGLYKVKYPTSMLHRGRVEAFIRITDSGILSGTRNLLITVERMVGSDETIEASDDFSALQTALTKLSAWEATISGKVDTWEADMEATKQLYIDTLTAAEAAYPQELVSLTSQLADKADETDLAIERARITNLATLAAGSTTGDAELIDGRVGADGVTYGNIGGAIRGQIGAIKQNIDNLINDTIEVRIGKNLCPPRLYDGYLEADGSITVYSDWKTTDYIPVSSLTSVAYSVSDATETRLLGVAMFFLTTYDSAKNRLEQIASPSSAYTVGAGVTYIRFSIHSSEHHDMMVESGTEASATYEPYTETYKAVNADYALKTEVSEAQEYVSDIRNNFSLNYQIYTPVYANSPSAIWNDGEIITNLPDTSTTNEIDCSDWESIMYTGSSWLGCGVIAFYDANHVWVSSAPAIYQTTALNNEIIPVPQNAEYVIFSNLSLRVAQTISIKVATDYKMLGKWSGKKWVCLGDSLTEANLRTTMNYHDYVAGSTDITVVNMGRSGSGYKRSEDDGNAFHQRSVNIPIDADVVTIFGSGNDLLYIADLGIPLDTGTTTICGCINITIDNIIALKPTVSLGIVSPTPWVGNQPTLDDSNGMALYTEALRQICKIRSIPFLDLYHCSNLRPWTEEGRAACYSKDEGNGVHPDENGHMIIAPRFKAFLESLLM